MREILFRGKEVADGKWNEGFYSAEEYNPYSGEVEHIPRIQIIGKCVSLGVIPETVGQFTGLTDKNGTKIFEGDIIQSLESSVTGLVQWFPEHSAFMVWCKSANEVGFLYECVNIIKVIGNIHDNSELLKGGEDNG